MLAAACNGEIALPVGGPGSVTGAGGGGSTDPNQQPPENPCATRTVADQPLRRLSQPQYHNVIADLFGAQAPALISGSLFPPTVITRGFVNDAEANTVNTEQSNAIEDNAEKIATAILATPDPYLRALLPCTLQATVSDADIDACKDGFISSFGQRAYRRPLTDAERTIARSVYDTVRASQSATNAFAATVQFFVESPALLYRVERGTTAADGPGSRVRLSDDEMATRLSFLFLDGPPDAALLDAAAKHELSTPEQVATQARRLVNDARLQPVLENFHRDWLRLYDAANGKDPNLFPNYTAAVRASLSAEPGQFIREVMKGESTIAALLAGPRVPVDATTASYYRVSAPVAPWAPTQVPHRQGLLTLASVQAALGKPTQSSPIHRGNFIRSSVLCEPQLMLPANVDTSTPLQATSGANTAKERLAPLLTRGDCSGCHSQINPVGFAFENYDSAGQWRDQENGGTIDASGSVILDNGPVAFSGPEQFVEAVAASQKAQKCYALNWFRAAQGRRETTDDQCSVAQLQQRVAASNGDLRELLVALTQTDSFFFRRAVTP